MASARSAVVAIIHPLFTWYSGTTTFKSRLRSFIRSWTRPLASGGFCKMPASPARGPEVTCTWSPTLRVEWAARTPAAVALPFTGILGHNHFLVHRRRGVVESHQALDPRTPHHRMILVRASVAG